MSAINTQDPGIVQCSSSSAVSRDDNLQNLQGDGLLEPQISKIDSAESLNTPLGEDDAGGVTGNVILRRRGHQKFSAPTRDRASSRSNSPQPTNPVFSIATTALSTYLQAVFMCLLATWLAVGEIWCEARNYVVREKVSTARNVKIAANALGSG